MRIGDAYVRFYKAFNFDYLRAAHQDFEPSPWDVTSSGLVYPYVRVAIEPDITPVVGANESGKSQLLEAIEFMLDGEAASHLDFCRYSVFFGASEDPPRPDFGLRLTDLTTAEETQILRLLSLAFAEVDSEDDEDDEEPTVTVTACDDSLIIDQALGKSLAKEGLREIRLFRVAGEALHIYVDVPLATSGAGPDEPTDGEDETAVSVDVREPAEELRTEEAEESAEAEEGQAETDNHELGGGDPASTLLEPAEPMSADIAPESFGRRYLRFEISHFDALNGILPRPFTIDATVPLPDRIALEFLANPRTEPKVVETRRALEEHAPELLVDWMANPDSIKEHADDISRIVNSSEVRSREDRAREKKQRILADLLICKIAGVKRSALRSLMDASGSPDSGYVLSMIADINEQLAAGLNFPKYWSQDSEFSLVVGLKGRDLVFTVRDRTGEDYKFSERSQGLKYFLSYFVQYLAHEYKRDRTEVLLMDEPDAYLSSQAQQDLLRLFDEFALGERHPHCQVVYATHSPFLLDKNHGERIRVLEKGDGDEGTRVVQNVSRNHFEPLRSAIGSFVAETTFISNCNLIVEGITDQVLLAAASSWLRVRRPTEVDVLDLNALTLVPAGSAGHIPYLAYLARGMDEDKPAVIVLFDGDGEGRRARDDLLAGLDGVKKLVGPEFVVSTSDLDGGDLPIENSEGATELEDLVPLELCREAAIRYCAQFRPNDALSDLRTMELEFAPGKSAADIIIEATAHATGGLVMTKLGLTRSLADLLGEEDPDPRLDDAFENLAMNFSALFRKLREAQEAAVAKDSEERTRSRIARLVRKFKKDNPRNASRLAAYRLINDIERGLDVGSVSEELFRSLERVRLDYSLDRDQREPVPNYAEFRTQIGRLSNIERLAAQSVGPR